MFLSGNLGESFCSMKGAEALGTFTRDFDYTPFFEVTV